jgi:chorismate mutase
MIIVSKYSSKCPACGGNIYAGDTVDWVRGSKARHAACAQGATNGHVVNAATGAAVPRETQAESLSRRFAVVQAEANTLRSERDALAASVTQLRNERNALRDELARVQGQLTALVTDAVVEFHAMVSESAEGENEGTPITDALVEPLPEPVVTDAVAEFHAMERQPIPTITVDDDDAF